MGPWHLTVPLHHLKVLDDDLGARTHEDLALAGLLSVVEGLKSIREDTHAHHLENLPTQHRVSVCGTARRQLYPERHMDTAFQAMDAEIAPQAGASTSLAAQDRTTPTFAERS
jgi:hypothetical protein